MDENLAYEEWKLDPSEVNLNRLIGSLSIHAKSVCWTKIPDHKQEHDWIVNGAVASAITGLDKFRGESTFSTWFHRIVLNECNMYLREVEPKDTVTLTDIQDTIEGPNVEELVLLKKDKEQALELIDGLPEDDQLILSLPTEGYPDDAIAEIIGSTSGSVRARRSKILARFKND
jgi:RNA polymerase sigma-70 factor (ECF subfamily)